MFNVAVLKMRDILKYSIGIILTILIIFLISKSFNKDNQNNNNMVVEKLENGISFLSKSNMLFALDQTIPAVSSLNEEYREISKEDKEIEKENILQIMLETQISSIKTMEKIEESKNEEATQENVENKDKETTEKTENQTLAQARS